MNRLESTLLSGSQARNAQRLRPSGPLNGDTGSRYMPGMRRAFTLMELLIVVAIIMILAGLCFPAFGMVKRQVNQVKCSNNLRQIAIALEIYRQNHDDTFPGHLYELIPEGFNAKSFLCPMDKYHGTQTTVGRRTNWTDLSFIHESKWTSGASAPSWWGGKPPLASSYCYEASGWRDATMCPSTVIGWYYFTTPLPVAGTVSWADGKLNQQKFGNLMPDNVTRGAPFPSGSLPIVRCYWHQEWSALSNSQSVNIKKVNNVSLDFNIFSSSPFWEHDANPAIGIPP
jgi:prepilin-type N-terminal cleavage/methylation domain-containing protein